MLAAALPLAAAPILGRLYSPADYGALATFMALSSLFGAVSTLQLPLGVIAERSERRAKILVVASVLVASTFALLASAVAFVLFFYMEAIASYTDMRGWLIMLPVTVLAGGITAGVAALANRNAEYSNLARIPVLTTITTVGSSIILGFKGWAEDGLLLSYFLGQGVGLVIYLRLACKLGVSVLDWRPYRIFAIAWRHRSFARYSTPSQVLSVVSLDIPLYVLSALGNAELLGAFHRARALVSMPMMLIGGAATQVFRQRASQDYRQTGSCRPIYIRTAMGLLAAGLPPLSLLLLYAPELFSFFLGSEWSEAGQVARILAPMLLLRLISSPLTSVFQFTDHQRLALVLSVASLIICATGVIWPIALGWGTIWAVVGFSISYSIIYAVHLPFTWCLTVQR